jgi:hypothetical protein
MLKKKKREMEERNKEHRAIERERERGRREQVRTRYVDLPILLCQGRQRVGFAFIVKRDNPLRSTTEFRALHFGETFFALFFFLFFLSISSL